MNIDEPTLMAVLGLASLAGSAMFFALSAFARQIPGVRFWAIGCLAVGFATVLDGPRVVENWQLASMLFNIPFGMGQVFILAGTMQFCGRPGAPRVMWLMSALVVLLTTAFTYLMPDSAWRIGTLSAQQAVLNGWTAYILWTYPDSVSRRPFHVASMAALFQSASALAQGILIVFSTVVVTYAAPQLPLANIISWAGVMMSVLVGNPILFLLVLLRLVADLRGAAERDVLTGLLNRRGLRPRLDAILDRPEAEAGHATLAVMLLDIDYFKAVNDKYGHDVGDKVLVVMGRVLLALNNPNAIVCRWGGEEFCVVVEAPTCDAVRGMAEQVRSRFEQETATMPELERGITVSIGIASMALDARFEMSALICAADAQLYRAKDAGRDRVAMAA